MTDPIHADWQSTDADGEAIPVRGSGPETVIAWRKEDAIRSTPQMDTGQHPSSITMQSRGAMWLAAICGIAIAAVFGALFYVGIDTLRGTLTETNTLTVTITKDGQFSPEEITVHANDTLTISNENEDPQVLKAKDGTELFPVQVLFDQPFVFTVPSSARPGTYRYFSETLPENIILTITVTEDTLAGGGTQAASSKTQEGIPLPSDAQSENIVPPAALSSSSVSAAASQYRSPTSSSSTPSVSVIITSASSSLTSTQKNSSGLPKGEIAILSLKQDMPMEEPSTAESSSASVQSTIPTNPYTIGNRLEAERQAYYANPPVKKETLRSGAPLLTNIKKPSATAKTGPDFWIVSFLAGGAMFVCYRRAVGKIARG